MIHEWRCYRLKAGAAPDYLALLADEGLPLVTRHLPLMGYWLAETGTLNTIHHLWSYADWAERESCRAGLAAEEAWVRGFVPKAFALVEEQRNRLLKITQTSPVFEAALARRREQRPARAIGVPLFATDCAVLSSGHSAGGAVAVWEAVSGEPEPPISLLPRAGDPVPREPLSGAGHVVLRPLCFSPL
ncbi:NIPSNAP family protein [Mycoplana rhizolycopersici]|uniref:NIPSNAP family protein n=1 Tax=Mycoplana rhizolycopersici TaxID=2746702 RepID=A0ABX2QKU8_9HYPH|nr:NIPSNAP family protein [Rhizobium rhizolycopersici]NVP58415.1 NIPSNAP family protein [Rhizobium rhizolycopersici]